MLAVTGPSGSGKTHLLERLIPALEARGLKVAIVKRCQHLDLPSTNKDGARLAAAGARPAVAVSPEALLAQNLRRRAPLLDLVACLCREADLVLIEGQRAGVFDKIVVLGEDSPERPASLPASARLLVGRARREAVDPDDHEAVAQWIVAWGERHRTPADGLLGVVLNGGAGRRMGYDKANLRLGGERVLTRLCELLADRIAEVIVVGREPQGADVPACIAWYPDDTPGLGPLGGIATALRIAAAQDARKAVFVVACDMPLVEGRAVDHILAGRDASAPATVALEEVTGRLHPLFGIYESHARPAIERAAGERHRSVSEWVRRHHGRQLPVPDTIARCLVNVNTPDDLEEIERASAGPTT